MEENAKTPFLKPALIYGAIVGFAGILLSLILYFLNLNAVTWTGYVTWAIIIALTVYCLVAYRNEYLGGFASFGQIFVMAVVIGLIASILSGIYTYLLHTVIDPDLIEKTRLMMEERLMDNPRITESMLDNFIERMENRMVPGRMAIMAVIWGTIINAIIGLIIAAFVKKEENPVTSAV